jgi:hypothetical protein
MLSIYLRILTCHICGVILVLGLMYMSTKGFFLTLIMGLMYMPALNRLSNYIRDLLLKLKEPGGGATD